MKYSFVKWVVASSCVAGMACTAELDSEGLMDEPDTAAVEQPLSAVSGTRPLLVILMKPKASKPEMTHTEESVDHKIWSDPNSSTDYSVTDYIAGVSNGKFKFEAPRDGRLWITRDLGSDSNEAAGVKDGDSSDVQYIKRGLYTL